MKKKIVILLTGLILGGVLLYSNKEIIYRYKKHFVSHSKNKNHQKVSSDITSTYLIWGVDLSHHQRKINWDTLAKKNQPYFIFFKATEGKTHKDTKYSEYSLKARSVGIRIGAYHFFNYKSKGDLQAQNFIKNANLQKGDLYPVLDVEFKNNMPNPAKVQREIQAFCNEIKKEFGVTPIIYCEYDYYDKYLRTGFKDYTYWICDFYVEPNRCKWIFWQYTDKANIKGIRGHIDKNLMNKTVNITDFLID